VVNKYQKDGVKCSCLSFFSKDWQPFALNKLSVVFFQFSFSSALGRFSMMLPRHSYSFLAAWKFTLKCNLLGFCLDAKKISSYTHMKTPIILTARKKDNQTISC
jgi:hypothetical protein